jgi:hypothetical protein
MNKILLITILLSGLMLGNLYSQIGTDLSINKDDASNKVNVSDLLFSKEYLQTPSASTIGDAGAANVDLFTGRATYSIPLYTFASHDLKLSISLSYASSGVTVDKLSDWTGMDWNLNAGGSITREIRGLPDETPSTGYFANGSRIKDFYSDSKNGINSLMDYNTKNNWLDAASKGEFDTEPDIYYFNAGGYSGKFVIDYNQVVHLIPYQYLVVTPIVNANKSMNGFIITTPDGIKYTFGVDANAIEQTHILGMSYQTHRVNLASVDYSTSNLETIKPTKEIPYYNSGWQLSKIESPVGDEIDLTYKATQIAYVTPQRTSISYWAGYQYFDNNGTRTNSDNYIFRGIFQTLKKDPLYQGSYAGSEGPWEHVEMVSLAYMNNCYVYTFSQSRFEVKQKRLSRISSKSGNYIEFISDNYRPDLTNGLELTAINIYDYNNTLIKSYYLNYSTVISEGYSKPGRNPFSIGEYLYFAKNTDVSPGNQYMPPPEIQNHIPNSTFYSSLGNYVGEGLKPYNYNRLFLHSITEANGLQLKPPYIFSYTAPEKLSRRTCNWVDYSGYNNKDTADLLQNIGKPGTGILVETGLNNYDETGPGQYFDENGKLKYRRARQIPVHVSQSGLLNLIKTPLGGEISFIFEDNIIADNTPYDTFPKPGCRVARLIKKENAAALPLITKYNYSKDKNWYYKPAYIQYRPLYQEFMYSTDKGQTYNNPMAVAYKTKVLSTSDLGNAISTNGSTLGYKQVEVIATNASETGTLGKEVFTFSVDNDPTCNLSVTPVLSLDTWAGSHLKTENVYRIDSDQRYMFDQIRYPVFDFSFKRGVLLNHLVLDNNGLRLKSTTNTYTSVNLDTVSAINANNFSILKQYGGGAVTRREACFYGHPSTWFTLGSVADTTFDQNNKNKFQVNKKDYSYNNLNGLPSQISTKQSNGLNYDVKIQYYVDNMFKDTNYSYDLTDPFTKGIKAMEAKNIRSAVLEKIERCNGKLISGSLMEYAGYPALNSTTNALPAKIHKLNIASPIAGQGSMAYFNSVLANGLYKKVLQADPNYKIEAYFDQYDSLGKSLQVHKANDVNTSYIYGYNKTLPIAKITNAATDQIVFENFEEGIRSGWGNFGSGTTVISNEEQYTGKQSLKISAGTYGGLVLGLGSANFNLTGKYRFSAKVKVKNPSTAKPALSAYISYNNGNSTAYIDPVLAINTGGWEHLETEINCNNYPNISYVLIYLLNGTYGAANYGEVYYDDVRLCPSNALMTTYTHIPLLGVSSVTDERNSPTYFEYDIFGRLKLEKDKDGNILKTYEYNYQVR